MNDNISKLYGALKSKGYTDIGKDEDAFRDWIGKEGNVKILYGALSKNGYDDIGDEAQFTEWVGVKPPQDMTNQETSSYQPTPEEVQQYTLQNKPDIFKPKTGSLVDRAAGIEAQEQPTFEVPNVLRGITTKETVEDLNNTVANAYSTANQMGERMNARVDMLSKNIQDPEYLKSRNELELRVLASEIDGLLDKEHGRLKSKAPIGQNAFNAIMGSRQYNQSNKSTQKNISNLDSAKRLIEQSQYIVDAAKRGDTGILSDTWQGFKDSLEAEDFTFGLADAASSAAILDAIKKVEKGEQLTESEDKLLRASAINMAVQYYFANDIGQAYKMGQVSAESVPFMLEMAINPISSFGKASAKTLLNYGLKAYAKQVGKGLAKGAVAGTGMALTTGLGRVASGTTDRLSQGYNYGVDFDGNLFAEKKKDAMGVGEAFARSLASTAIENQSEMIFNAFKGMGGFMKGVEKVLPGGVNKFFDMLSHNKVADAYRWLKNSPVFRNYLVKDVRNATQIGGIFEEYAEEVYNNLANFAIGEMSWEDVVSLDKNIDTFLGLAPTQVMFGILGLGGAASMRYQTRKTLEDLKATMNEQQRKELEGLLDMGIDAKEVDVRGFIRGVMENQNYTIENKRDLIKAAYYVAQQRSIDELTEADVIDKVNAENQFIDSMTDPSTGNYAELSRTVVNPKTGESEQQKGYVVGWIGEGDKRQPIFVADGMDNNYANRVVLKPTEWSMDSYREMPAEQVKAVNEEMNREEAAQQAANESRWHPNVPEPTQGTRFMLETDNGIEDMTVVGVDAEQGSVFVVDSEEYRNAQGNPKKLEQLTMQAYQLGGIPMDKYKDAMTAQIEADEKAAQYNKPITNEDSVVRNGKTYTVTGVGADGVQYMDETGESYQVPLNTWKSWAYDQEQTMKPNAPSGENVGEEVNAEVNAPVNNENVQPVAEVVASEAQAEQPKQPTLEEVVATLPKTKNNEIDYKAMTPQQQYQYTSLTESPEVALEDLQADIAAGQEEIAKKQEKLSKARGGERAALRDEVRKLTQAQAELQAFYESIAPKQEEVANEESVEPIANTSKEAIDEPKVTEVRSEQPKVKKPKKKKSLFGQKKKDSEFTEEEMQPMNAVEFAASHLASGNIAITTESFKRETGYGEAERKKFMGMLRTPEKGGMTIEQAAEKLVSLDNEQNGHFFEGDTQAARDTIIELLGYETWGDVANLIKNNRTAERKKREEAEYAEYEAYLMEALHVTPEELELQKEYDEQNNPFPDVSEEEYFAKFAEKAEEYINYLNSYSNEQGRTDEVAGRNDSLLSEERAGDIGGNQRSESGRESKETGSESIHDSKTSQESTSGSEVVPSIEETNVSRMADIEAEILDIDGRKLEIEDELNELGDSDLLAKAALIDELSRLDELQAELQAEYSGLYNMNEESRAIIKEEGGTPLFRQKGKRTKADKKPFVERAKHWEEKTGVKIRIANNLRDVKNRSAFVQILRGSQVTGWFEESTGEVVLYMPHIASIEEVDTTFIHEVVAHKGLRGLLGERFNEFLDEVWNMMSRADQAKYLNYPGVNGDKRAAADEYIANTFETIDVTESAWSKLTELIKRFLKALGLEPKMTNADIANTIKNSYQRLLEGEGGASVVGEGTRFSAKRTSDRRQEINRLNNTVDQALSLVYGKDIKEVRKERQEQEQKRKEDAEEIYQSVLSGDFNDVTLQKINDYIDDATPLHPYGRRISQRLPQKLERSLHEGSRTNAVDALFSRIHEKAVPASRRTSEAGRREIEERKKEALKGWAIATNNWHTDLSEFTDEQIPIGEGTDSKVYASKDGKYVIKTSFGKPEGKRFRPDIDNIPLFNSVFRNSAYEIVGYGEFDGKFARILKQPFVEFAEDSKVPVDERVDYMRTLGFEPINEAKTAFSNGTIIVADLQKSNIVKTAQGNIRVIDADVKLHTKDVGGNYTYPPVEADLPEGKISFRAVKDKNELVAVHNISEDNLRKVLEVGGLIMPSIAITKADMGHEGYGEISLLFEKETINPADRRNKVYGGDAWTPRFPSTTAKINDKVFSKVYKKIKELIDDRSLKDLYSLSAELHADNIERTISDRGVGGYYDKEWMKLAYLLDNGKNVKIPMKMKDYGAMSEKILEMVKERGLKASDIQDGGYKFYQDNADIVEAVKRVEIENKLQSFPEEKRDALEKLLNEKDMTYSRFDSLISSAIRMEYDLENGGLKKIIDRAALRESIEKKVKTNNADYNKWVDNLFDGIVEKYGIRNNRDWYTPSGNLRPWEQLYDNATPANILKHMLAENEQGGSGGFFDSNIMGASAETYESIEEIREKGKKRLRRLEDGEYDEWSNSISERMSEICNEFLSPSQRKEFGAAIDAKIDITNAVAKDKTADGIYKAMKRKYPGFKKEHSKKVEEIVKEIQDFAIGYFEAKPRRIVPLNEVRKAIVPKKTSEDILEGLKNNGIEIATYKNGDETARARLIKKESDGIRFRIANKNQEIFVSNAQRAVEGIKQEKGTPQQWLAMIEKNGGLKAGEDKWLGLSDWLKGLDKKSVTKDEILNFIGENKIRIEEVTYGDWDNLDKRINSIRRDYTTQGIMNKQEIALTVPTIEPWDEDDEIHFGDAGEGRAVAWIRFGETSIPDKGLSEKSMMLGTEEWWNLSTEERNAFTEELMELKRNTIPTRVLVIDEIQSKRHQEGREKGYKSQADKTPARMEDLTFGEYNGLITATYKGERLYFSKEKSKEEILEMINERIADAQLGNANNLIPDAPFEKNWSELAFKRMLRYAAENGFDKVAWTTGAQQAERYNIGGVVSSINYFLRGDGSYRVETYGSNGYQIESIPTEFKDGQALADVFGKELATKMVKDLEEDRVKEEEAKKSKKEIRAKMRELDDESAEYESLLEEFGKYDSVQDTINAGHEISGDGLRVGGEGMKGFYDKMLPSFVNKYVKKWGTKVQDIELPNVEEAGRIMHSVDVTEAMKESVMEGQTMFRVVKDSAVDYISQANDVVEVPRDEVMYTVNNIANQLYKVSGRFMRELYKYGTIGRVLKGEYAEIDQIKAKKEYDHAKPIFDEYLNELVWMKYQSTEAAQEVINDVISDVEYAMQYYKDLALGKDVWRTKNGPRFRISEKHRKDVSKAIADFTSSYNSKPVSYITNDMTDEQVDDLLEGYLDSEDVQRMKNEGAHGFYLRKTDRIYIFVDDIPLESVENSMFHENLHLLLGVNNPLTSVLWDKVKDKPNKFIEVLKNSYRSDEWAEEYFVYHMAKGLSEGELEKFISNFAEADKEALFNILNTLGYEYESESRERLGQRRRIRATSNSLQQGGKSGERRSGESREALARKAEERKERLQQLFGRVADMGLDGVLGNKEYVNAMVDMYKVLPEAVQREVADEALSRYGGDVAPAVSDWLNHKAEASVWDKVVAVIREALRKVGFDLDLNTNEAKYILWRSQKPLNRNNLFEMAEDIDMKYRLKVGEYSTNDDGTTPDGGGTRFSVKSKPKTKAELKEEVRDLKEDVKDLKDEVKDLKKQVNTLRSGNKDEWEEKQRAIVSFIKGRLTKEAGSVLGKTRLDQLLTLVNKASTATDLHKPLQFIEQVINDASIEYAAAKMDKLIKTKLQGETNRGVAKGVVVDETTRRLFDSIRGTFKDLITTSIDSELRYVRGEILRFGREINDLPKDDIQGRAILTAKQDAMKERRKELEKEQEEIQRQNIAETKESLERRHDELVEAMDAHIEGKGIWTQEMRDEYDSIPLRMKLAEIRESQAQLDAIMADAIMTRREAYKNTGEARKKLLAEADIIESNYTIAQEELMRLMDEVSSELSAIINEGKSRLATRREALAERRRAIVTMGISAVKDKKIQDPNATLSKKEKFEKWFDNSWMKSVSDFMTAPLNSFNFMLKYIDRNHTIGEGELYNHFMKSKEGALEANNQLYDGLKAYNTAIEEKAKEIFGKSIEKVMKESGKEYIGKVHKQYMYDSSSHKEGEMYPISITKGQAFYVWLTWRQDDGRAKLVADGWNDQSIEEIEDLIGEDYMKFGEWVTDEFFPMLRDEKYNKTHIDMFGTSMAKREHYFPFKVQQSDIQEKGEMGESYSGMPSTITGNIIKRTINKSRIKTDQNAFDMLYKYGNDMETWNAMAKLRQDLNFLHSSKAFRNYLEANSKGLFDKFMKAAEVAVKAYNNSEKDAINDFFAKLNRTWAGTNIGFRLNTAMKQILSYPAFMAYSGNLKYQGYLMKYMLNWVGNYKWAKENLPAFRNRVESGDMGMTGMTDPSFDLGKVINKFGEWGMIPNQLVDALTCAAGARSVYDFEYNRAIKVGMLEEEAKNIAQYNAEVAFNETQQSSRDEFVSPTQVSRNVLIKSMMNYQNSNVGYQRMGNEGLLEIMRAKHVYEQDIKNGMNENEAKKKVANSVIRGTRKMMIAFTILPGLWYLGGRGIVGITAPLISSLFGGDDDDEPYLDDEAKKGLMLSMALGTVAGTSGGQAIASVVQGREYEPMAYVKEFTKIITDAIDNGFNLNTTKNIALKLAKFGGVNVETFENIYLGVEHAIRTGNFDLVDFMFLINLPPSQRKAMAEELYSNMPFMEYAEKVARAQKLFDDYRKNLPYAKGDKNGSKKNAIKKQYVIENLDDDKQDKLEKEKEFKKLQREYNSAEDKDEWLEDHPEYKELEMNFKRQEVTKEVNRKTKELK